MMGFKMVGCSWHRYFIVLAKPNQKLGMLLSDFKYLKYSVSPDVSAALLNSVETRLRTKVYGKN